MKTMFETLREIARPVPHALVSVKEAQGGAKLSFMSWYNRLDLMDERCPQFSYEIVRDWVSDVPRGKRGATVPMAMRHVIVRGTIPCSDGTIVREQIGVDEEPDNQYGTPYERALGAGLSRLTASFGLARELYDGAGWKLRQRVIATENGVLAGSGKEAPSGTFAQASPELEKAPDGVAVFPDDEPDSTGASRTAATGYRADVDGDGNVCVIVDATGEVISPWDVVVPPKYWGASKAKVPAGLPAGATLGDLVDAMAVEALGSLATMPVKSDEEERFVQVARVTLDAAHEMAV